MAYEIKKQIILSLTNGIDKSSSNRGQKSATQATARPDTLTGAKSVNVSTDAAITLPVDAADYGETIFENLDADTAKYITIGPEAAGAIAPFLRVYGGQQASMQIVPSITLRAVASAGTQVLHIFAIAK